jgi:starch synthase
MLNEQYLNPDPTIPLMIYIGRMDRQKGVDLIISSLAAIPEEKWNVIILGTGDPQLESACEKLQEIFPSKVRVINRFDSALAHQLYAAGDILLMPSRYEPCGLAQMIAMRYGSIPVAADTGGLHDTIRSIDTSVNGTGFLFSPVTPSAFSKAIRSALHKFTECPEWESTQARVMSLDFGWGHSAAAYFSLYRSMIKGTRAAQND